MVPQLNIGALFPTYVLILFIPLCWPFLRIDLDKNGLNRVILRFRLGSSSWFPEMEIDIQRVCRFRVTFTHAWFPNIY